MLFTDASIKKNLAKVLPAEEFVAVFSGQSDRVGRGLFVFTRSNRFLVFATSLFGKPKLKFEYNIAQIENFDIYSVKLLSVSQQQIVFNYQGKQERIKVFAAYLRDFDQSLSDLLNAVYRANPKAKPAYMQDQQLVLQIGTSNGAMRITDKKVMFFSFENNQIQLSETYDITKLHDFDAFYKTHINIALYLAFEHQQLNLSAEDFAASINEIKTPLSVLIAALDQTLSPVKKPSYLQPDEQYIYDTKTSTLPGGMEILQKLYFMLTDKNIYLLEASKSDRRHIKERYPLEQIAKYKVFQTQTPNFIEYGLKLTLADGRVVKFYRVDNVDFVVSVLAQLISHLPE